ncbi:hypothetical protein [Novosphingobium sp.]|uniref:spike base protein, RCAP_Rcc01079 family n=1 Tax=Novosphingobium sp. TaxID=1874826 RepID=UPI00286DAD7E|nr:hypothetical protein [Novosphingobium sp.]
MGKNINSINGISPALEKIAVNLAGDTTFAIPAKAIFVGTGGTVIGRAPGSSADVTYKNVANGQLLDGYFEIIRSTANGTTAADLVAEF